MTHSGEKIEMLKKSGFGMMLTLMVIGISTLGVNFSLTRVSVSIAERSSGVVVRLATAS